MKPLATLAAALLLAFGSASVADPIKGAGTRTCATWTALRAAGDIPRGLELYQWFLGFVSSYNHYVMRYAPRMPPDGAFPDDSDTLLPWLDDYCRRYPRDDIYYAGQALIRERTIGK